MDSEGIRAELESLSDLDDLLSPAGNIADLSEWAFRELHEGARDREDPADTGEAHVQDQRATPKDTNVTDRRKRKTPSILIEAESSGQGKKKKAAEDGKKSAKSQKPAKKAKTKAGKEAKKQKSDKGEKEKQKTKKKSKKDKKKESSASSASSSSDSSPSSSSSSSDTSSSDSASESDSSASSSAKNSSKKKKGKGKSIDLELLEVLWPREDRPRKLQSKKVLKDLSMTKLMKMKELFEKEQEKKGLGAAIFSKDRKPKARKYKKMTDDGEKKLHPARFESMPRVDPKEYWDLVPTNRPEIFRHMPLQHLGIDDMPESTVVKMHDRKVPVELDMMAREVKTMRQAQMAVCNYVTVLRCLHPIDMGGMTIQLVLTEAGWAETIGETDKIKLAVVKRFFDDSVRDNSGRAVRKQPPMDYEQVI